MTTEEETKTPTLRAEATGMAEGAVAHVEDVHRCTVRLAGGEVVPCDVLHASDALPLRLAVGETVLVWGAGVRERGVVMGRIGAPAPASEESAGTDELILDAGERLVLRCGDGSVEIRKDGKILIKGKDVVSHAKRVNRIRGGSVAIN